MIGGAPRGALDAVNAARPIVARLGTSGDKEDVAADIIEAWGSVETGLRSLVGGTTLAGQALIRELRQRQFLSLEQANSLAEFHAARERAGRTDYAPTDADVNAVRDAFLKLEAGMLAGAEPARAVAVPVAPVPSEPVIVAPPGKRSPWKLLALAAAVPVIAFAIWWGVAGRSSNASYDQGVVAYGEGRKEAAEGLFRKAATDDANDPMPHVYLSRIERERGNLMNANAEAVKAVQLGPNTGPALRELASVLFAQQNFDGARTFYIRAIREDSTDRLAQGYLACSLVRLGRFEESTRWFQRAGSGAWSSCVPAATGTVGNPAVPMTVPR